MKPIRTNTFDFPTLIRNGFVYPIFGAALAIALNLSAREATPPAGGGSEPCRVKAEVVNERIGEIPVHPMSKPRYEMFLGEKPIPMDASTVVRLTLRSRVGGIGVIWFQPVGEKGPISKGGVSFNVIGDGAWHTYSLRSAWIEPHDVMGFRLDLPMGVGRPDEKTLVGDEVKEIVFERSGVHAFDSSEADGLVFRMRDDALRFLSVNWTTCKADQSMQPYHTGFMTVADGREHTRWIDFRHTQARMTFGGPHWYGTIRGLHFKNFHASAEFVPEGLAFVKGTPDLPADPVIRQVFPEDAIPRAGRTLPLEVVVRNYGTRAAEGLRFDVQGLPGGLAVIDARDLAPTGCVAASKGYEYIRDDYMPNGLPNERRFRITLNDPGKACSFTAKLVLTAKGGATSEKTFDVNVGPDLHLARCDYVPEPKKVDTGDVKIGAFLFPGWKNHQYYPDWDAMPWRRPVLGWYDEDSAEVKDWQTKFLAENGVSFVSFCWYWKSEKGPGRNDNSWVKHFRESKYRRLLQYCILWCNEGTYRHTEKDQRMVTQKWIDTLFSDEQYLRIDGKPVVMVLCGRHMHASLGAKETKRFLTISREMARAAGYPGIYFVGGRNSNSEDRKQLAFMAEDDCWDASIVYYYDTYRTARDCGYDANGNRDFSMVADSSLEHWRGVRKALPEVKLWPSLSTSTDNRVWLGDRGRYLTGCTPAKFEKICRDAKTYVRETGDKFLMMGPLDEWCEGEIGWPNAEHGFGMLEAVRKVFAKEPAGGFPLNYTPRDVGLGPYTKACAVIPASAVSASPTR